MRLTSTVMLLCLGVACGCHDFASGGGDGSGSGTAGDTSTGGTEPGTSGADDLCEVGTLGCACGPAGCDPDLVCDPQGICAEALVCGNGVLEAAESCDDGNLVDFDGCNADCTPTANEEWSDPPYGDPGPCDDYLGVAHSAQNRLAVVGGLGRSMNSLDNCQIVLKVFDPFDTEAFTKVIDPGPNCDEAWGVDFDAAGNIWVAGRSFSPERLNDQWIGKYDPNGNELWTKSLDGGLEDYLYALSIQYPGEPQERAIVAGARQTDTDGFDISVKALTADGDTIWSRSFDQDGGNDIALDVRTYGDEIYVGGFVTQTGQDENAWAARFDGSGQVLWTHRHNGPISDQDRVGGVARADNGDVVIAGFETSDHNQDIWVRRLSSDGQVLWTRSFDGPELLWADRGQEVAIDLSGNIIVAGQSWVPGSSAGSFDTWLRKYDPSGNPLWTLTDQDGDGPDVWYAVTTDQDDIYVAGGLSLEPGDCTDAVVRRYGP